MTGSITHIARVRALYKALLRLHRSLPLQMKALGDQYVKEEFRLHKKANEAETEVFMHEWTVRVSILAPFFSVLVIVFFNVHIFLSSNFKT